jgi:tetratricopeptide (TPR) repeat protein
MVDQPAGDIRIRTTTEVKRTLSFTLASRQTRYVRLEASIGFFVAHVYPNLVEEEIALAELEGLQFGALAEDKWTEKLLERAEAFHASGSHQKALRRLDEAQARAEPISELQVRAIKLRASVLEALGRHEEALAHQDYLARHRPESRSKKSTGSPQDATPRGFDIILPSRT